MNLTLRSRIEKFSKIVELTKISNAQNQACDLDAAIISLQKRLLALKNNRKNLYIIGNGGSAGVAAHAATDFFNVAKIRATTLHESSLLTCMANDFGYENWISEAIKSYADSGDLLILISSSGQSKNILNGAQTAQALGIKIVTFSGFLEDNPLRKLGYLNFYVNSLSYNLVEMTHYVWLLSSIDFAISQKDLAR
jgi:D-sedoheptulose 7-phosphate isomerase